MWWRAVFLQTLLLLVSCTHDVRYYKHKRVYPLSSQVECFDYPEWGPTRYTRGIHPGWIYRTKSPDFMVFDSDSYTPSFLRRNLISRRFDLFPSKEDIVKEHAKLVRDINSLTQKLYVAPLADRSKDYDDSIYLEAIETTTTSRPIKYSVVGGASQHTVAKSQPMRFSSPTVSLVGTPVSPLVKHPYPFVMHPSSSHSMRICMPMASPTMPTYSKPKPGLLQKILNGIISR